MYPQPGLYSKFFTVDLEPLVEVVRDTVGRHDTFGLACTRKYYEDKGYFGHVNCSENFNAQLDPYTVDAAQPAGRRSTSSSTPRFDAHNLYILDEPWSRPGDYVLLRATTDLVCLSSACPDDIDAANALEPDRGARPRLPGQGAVQRRDRPPRHTRRRAQADEGDGLRQRTRGADEPLHRVQRLLAADLVRQPRRGGRVLGLPRARGDHGSVAAAEVRGARARRRGAAAGDPDPRHPPALGRPGRLHRDVQRHGRHDRRRHRVPHRADQLPLGRWRRSTAACGCASRPSGSGYASG